MSISTGLHDHCLKMLPQLPQCWICHNLFSQSLCSQFCHFLTHLLGWNLDLRSEKHKETENCLNPKLLKENRRLIVVTKVKVQLGARSLEPSPCSLWPEHYGSNKGTWFTFPSALFTLPLGSWGPRQVYCDCTAGLAGLLTCSSSLLYAWKPILLHLDIHSSIVMALILPIIGNIKKQRNWHLLKWKGVDKNPVISSQQLNAEFDLLRGKESSTSSSCPPRAPPVAQVSRGSLKIIELPSWLPRWGNGDLGCPSDLSGCMAGWWRPCWCPLYIPSCLHVTTWSSQKGKPSSPLAITPSWKYDCLDFSPIFCMTSDPIV